MTHGDRLCELFDRACGLADEERERFLDRECGGDPGLREELVALLAADRRAGSGPGTAALAAPLQAMAAEVAGRPNIPERIGSFRIVDLLGEGGMGIVYRAEQLEPLRRDVALKLIRGGFDSASVVARFEAERQALALMDHPNIAHVYEAGATDDGAPYFAMEWVQGTPITRYCLDNGLSTTDRLRLFIEVCAGVQHAHHRGIVHRDLKPSNILVTDGDEPAPKIIDFGIAKVVGERLTDRPATRVGAVVGTLEYMSPEQANGRIAEIDLRSDVYSLGVVLFEILSGDLPHDLSGLSVTEAARKICETDSKRIGAVDRRLRGDLETIVAKALERDPERRYPSPGSLADDIERYLENRPILARPPSVVYQVRKLVSRQKLSSALVLLLLVVATLAFGMNVASRRRAERETAIASTVSSLLLDMFESADPLGTHGPDLTVRQLIDEFDERSLDKLEAHPEVEAQVRGWLGRAFSSLGAYDKTYRQQKRVEELLVATQGAQSRTLGTLWIGMGWSLHEMARYEEAAEYFRKAMAFFAPLGSAEDHAYTRAQVGLADTLTHQERYDEAREQSGKALATFTGGSEDHPQTGMVLVNLAIIEKNSGNLDAAASYARRAVEFERSAPRTGYGTGFLADRELAEVLLARAEYPEAEEILRGQLRTLEKVYPTGHATLLQVASLLGESLIRQEHYREAEVVLRRIDPQAAGFKFLDERETSAALSRLSQVYEQLGDLEKARSYRSLIGEATPQSP